MTRERDTAALVTGDLRLVSMVLKSDEKTWLPRLPMEMKSLTRDRIYPCCRFPSIKIQSRRITMTKLSSGQEYLTPFVGDCDRNSGSLCIFRTVQGPPLRVLPFVRSPPLDIYVNFPFGSRLMLVPLASPFCRNDEFYSRPRSFSARRN